MFRSDTYSTHHSHSLAVGMDQADGDAISCFVPMTWLLGEWEKDQPCFWTSWDPALTIQALKPRQQVTYLGEHSDGLQVGKAGPLSSWKDLDYCITRDGAGLLKSQIHHHFWPLTLLFRSCQQAQLCTASCCLPGQYRHPLPHTQGHHSPKQIHLYE